MTPAGLRLEQAPPLRIVLRFLLSAPVFGVLAGLLLAWRGPEAFASRHTMESLALAHLFALGFMGMTMLGSALQILPVLAGVPVPRVAALGTASHVGLALGTLALCAGFLAGLPVLLKAGVAALGIGFAVFAIGAAFALARAPVASPTVRAMRLAVLALAVTVVLGLVLGTSYGWGIGLPHPGLRDVHPVWGVFGWTGVLVLGVAFQVVPMFQLTPAYPGLFSRHFAAALLALLVAWSAAALAEAPGWVQAVLAAALSAAASLFALVTLGLQRRRRRRRRDATTDFWRVGMASALAGAVLWTAHAFGLLGGEFEMAIGVLALAGFAGSVIIGMLIKIVPFLVWFHLQSLCGRSVSVPDMHRIFPERASRAQLLAHLVALALLLAAVPWPEPLSRVAGLAVATSFGLLAFHLARAARTFRATLALAGEAPAGRRLAGQGGSS